MTVEKVLEVIGKAGLTLGLHNTNSIKVTPKELITPNIRELIKNYKVELIWFLSNTSSQTERPKNEIDFELRFLEAAMSACNFWTDSQLARAEMVADLKATPPNRRQELLEHFLEAYRKTK